MGHPEVYDNALCRDHLKEDCAQVLHLLLICFDLYQALRFICLTYIIIILQGLMKCGNTVTTTKVSSKREYFRQS